MVSCGRDNIRLWRVKDGTLRSAPVSLGEYQSVDFTDICFESSYQANKNPEDKLMWVCPSLNTCSCVNCPVHGKFLLYCVNLIWCFLQSFWALIANERCYMSPLFICLFSYACSRSGHMFEIDYQKVAVRHVRRLLPIYAKEKNKKSVHSGQFIMALEWLQSLVTFFLGGG